MMHDDDKDTMMKDKILAALIDHIEDILGNDLKKKKGLAVQVAAPDKESLAAGLDKAKDVVQHDPEALDGDDEDSHESEDDDSDEARLAALLGGDSEDDEDDEEDDEEEDKHRF